MINYRVANLDSLLTALAKEGVGIDLRREDYDYGPFAWIVDREGNHIQLWEPPRMRARAKSERKAESKARSSIGRTNRKPARAVPSRRKKS